VQTSVAVLNRDDIIQRIRAGEKLTDIAQHYGYTNHSAIVNRLKNDPEYPIAREIGVEARMEARERELESADDSVTVARARELLGHARWRAEREFPHRWGNKQQIDLTGAVNVEHLVALKAESLLESIRAPQQCEVIDGESTKDDVSD